MKFLQKHKFNFATLIDYDKNIWKVNLLHAAMTFFCFVFVSHYARVDSNQLENEKFAIYLAQISTGSVRLMGGAIIVTGIGITARHLTFASMSGSTALTAAGDRIGFVVFLRKVCGFCLCVSTIRIPNKIIILHTYID